MCLVGCTKDHTDDVISPSSLTMGTLESSNALAAAATVNGSWDVSLATFKYVYQSKTLKDWKTSSLYKTTGPCGYPRYTGATTLSTTSTNLCGPASLLMGLSIVRHDATVAVPTDETAVAKRLVEFAKRYQSVDGSYSLGGYTGIAQLARLANGTSSIKGEFTNWTKCTEKQYTGTELYSVARTTTGRTLMKDFIRTHIKMGRPVLALITVQGSYKNADNVSYISTSGGIGHMVLITGVTEYDAKNTYRVRFKDPLAGNSKTYEVEYGRFLNSMITSASNYNALAIAGR